MALMKLIGISTHISLLKTAYRVAVYRYTIIKHIKLKSTSLHSLYYLRSHSSISVCAARSKTKYTVYFHGEGSTGFTSNNMHADEKYFLEQLCGLGSTEQVLRLLESSGYKTDTIIAATLQKLVDTESKTGLIYNSTEVFGNKILKAILCQYENEPQSISSQSLVKIVKALVQLGMDSYSTIMVSLFSECQERVNRRQMTIKNLCILGESLLIAEASNSPMLQSIMDQVQDLLVDTWTPEEMTMVYSLLQGLCDGSKYEHLLNQMHRTMFAKSNQLNPKLTSSVLGSLVALKQTQANSLVIQLFMCSVNYLSKFTDDELVKVLVALTEFEYKDPLLTEALEKHISEKVFTMSPEAVSHAMHYCSKKLILSKPIFNAVAENFVYNSERFTTHQIGQMIIPFGKLNYLPPDASAFFRQLETVLNNRFSQFQPRVLLNIVHSCTLVQRFPVNFLSKIFSIHFRQELQDQSGSFDPVVRCQLTQLYLTVILECPFYKGPKLQIGYRETCFLTSGDVLETGLNHILFKKVKKGLIQLLGCKQNFSYHVLSPYCYTLDVEIGLDADGIVLSTNCLKKSSKRIVLCIDDENRFCTNSHNLLGKEVIKQRHLRLLGYQVVQIPYFEINTFDGTEEMVDYLHKKIFPQSFRMKW